MTTAWHETTIDDHSRRDIEEREAWAAVAGRDAHYDSLFVYAVRTTRVYCRPSCSARRPRRENVQFFATPAAAERHGFRPCKRCRPREIAQGGAAELVHRATAFVDLHLDEPITLDRLARALRVSPFHLQRTFKRLVGLSPKRYQDARRVVRLKEQLRSGMTVTRAGFEAGFGSSRAVYEKAAAGLGMSPATYRRGGAGARIRYDLACCTLGHVIVAATDRGICAVMLGDDPHELIEAIAREFPRADLAPADGDLSTLVGAIVEHVEGVRPSLELPLDLEGTEFQRRVWRALQEIPYGSTRSYRDVAQSVDQPTAVRAVARACATNRAALVVPCHRVVRGDGSLSGYRWGVERKRRLLDQERAIAAQHAAANGGARGKRRTTGR